MGANDGTVFEGPGELKSAPVSRAGVGNQSANPNQHTKWDDGSGQRTPGRRPIDLMEGASPLEACTFCEYKTRIHPEFEYHMKKIGGLTKCQRQRQNFGKVQECDTCKGTGETATGVCRPCGGMGKTISSANAATVDTAAIVNAVTAAIAPSLDAIAKGLQALAAGRSIAKPRKIKGKGKKSAASRLDRGGDPGAGPAPLAHVEPAQQSVDDPPASAAQ